MYVGILHALCGFFQLLVQKNPCKAHSKPRSGDITPKCKITLANQKPEDKAEMAHYWNGLNNNGTAQQQVIHYVWQ